MIEWLILTATLPSTPSALRVRVWRALKATGAGSLRDGVYVLPASAPTAAALWELARQVSAAGADAHMLVVQARDEAQEQVFRALFDRSASYAQLHGSIQDVRESIGRLAPPLLRKTLRAVELQSRAIAASDFFAGDAAEQASSALASLRRAIEAHLSPGEPTPAAAALERLDRADFQGRTWATRARPWVDRLATAWLVHRFVDDSATFAWLSDIRQCPAAALGYDFDGARFTHVGERVTFEVVAASFGLDTAPGIARLGALVHCIDVGGPPVDEAPGIEMLVRGLQARHADDDALLAAALLLFDALHAATQVCDER
jgi:hypothetical protein